MQRQKQAKPSQTYTFQAQAISDIVAPVVDIETKDLTPAMTMSPMGDVGDVRVEFFFHRSKIYVRFQNP